ncbi:LysE family translocator [Teredinibacter franksiae]|uniref:LysE family translocator n=1 Tax=Teredinibacter franksiae TaxID=2761453 RepID=UPI001623930E|nr:LysE family translocator [Teredinibacter franksiae]
MEFYASILLFSVSTSITPGPNTVMLMSTSLNYGVRGSLPAYFGVCLGFMLMQMAIALGLGGLFVVFPWLHYAIKYVGALYLLFLAWKIAQMSGLANTLLGANPVGFWQAVALQWVNPKAITIAVGGIAAYTTPGEDALAQAMMVVAIFFFVGLFSMGVWVLFGAALQKLINSSSVSRYLNVSMAIALVLSIIPVLGSGLAAH